MNMKEQIIERIYEKPEIKVSIGEEKIVLEKGLQPYMFRTGEGTLLIQAHLPEPPDYYSSGKKNNFPGVVDTVISRDNAVTWQKWSYGYEREEGPVLEGCMTSLKDNTIIMLEWIAEAGEKSGKVTGKFWRSNDDLETLEGPFEAAFSIPDLESDGYDDNGRPYSGTTFHRTLMELENGDLIASVYCWFKTDDISSTYEPKMKKFRTIAVRSKDRGKNWDYMSTVASGNVGTEGFCEPVMVRLTHGAKKGRMICMMRTGRELYCSVSDDEGYTWSEALPVEFDGIDIYDTKSFNQMFEDSGNIELKGAFVDPDLIEMRNGVLVCAFGVRMPEKGCFKDPGHDKNGNYIAFSFDSGQTWTNVLQLTSGIMTTHYMGIRESGEGELITAYDLGRWKSEKRCICIKTIKVDIMK